MDELLARLAEVADLERTAVLLAWDQEVCIPPAGVAGHGELRATIGRLAHERFIDEQVGELLEAAQPGDDIEADAVRVARRDFDKARRVSGELVAEIARTAAAAPVAWLEAPALVGQLGDPSAQVSGALADRTVVGVPADAAAVAHREGVLPGPKKGPEFVSKLVQVVHRLSHLSVARVASSAPRLSY